MDLRQLSYVVAVADHGGFTRAAEAVHVTQPALSQAVRTLEAELGVELFHRTGRSVVLTAAGEALLGPARRALRDAETARAAVAEVAGLAETGRRFQPLSDGEEKMLLEVFRPHARRLAYYRGVF